MAKKTFNLDVLSMKSVRNLQKELRAYQSTLQEKTEEFARRLADVGITVIEKKMDEATQTVDANGIVSGSDTSHKTYVTVTSFGTMAQAVLTVEGQSLLFLEFGAGVHYNGSAGSSPHPKGQKFGYTIGSYGKGQGKYDSWSYVNENGETVTTYGTEAAMPVYSASLKIIEDYKRIAKEVFGQ